MSYLLIILGSSGFWWCPSFQHAFVFQWLQFRSLVHLTVTHITMYGMAPTMNTVVIQMRTCNVMLDTHNKFNKFHNFTKPFFPRLFIINFSKFAYRTSYRASCSIWWTTHHTSYNLFHQEIVHKTIAELICFIWIANW